jgi:hypothetical protein
LIKAAEEFIAGKEGAEEAQADPAQIVAEYAPQGAPPPTGSRSSRRVPSTPPPPITRENGRPPFSGDFPSDCEPLTRDSASPVAKRVLYGPRSAGRCDRSPPRSCNGDKAHRDWLIKAAEEFIAGKTAPKKPKLTRLRSWLSRRRRVPHLPPAPDRPKVPSTPHPLRGKMAAPRFPAISRPIVSLSRAIVRPR